MVESPNVKTAVSASQRDAPYWGEGSDMQRTRRAVLSSTVALLGAGCLGRRSPGGTPEETTSTDGNETPDGSPLETVAVHQSIRKRGVAHTDVKTGVFVVGTFADDGTVERNDVALSLDGTRHDPVDWVVPASDGTVAVAFEFPKEGSAATDGTLEWGTGSWSLSDGTLKRLSSPPQFTVREFSIPDEAPGDSEITATIGVENTGESDGRFLAEFGSMRLSDQSEITIQVPAGERVSASRSINLHQQEGEETLVLDWGNDRLKRTVSLDQT